MTWERWRWLVFGSLAFAGVIGMQVITIHLLLQPPKPVEITVEVVERGEKLCTVQLTPPILVPLPPETP